MDGCVPGSEGRLPAREPAQLSSGACSEAGQHAATGAFTVAVDVPVANVAVTR